MWIFNKPDKSAFVNWRGYLIGIAGVALATWLKYLAQPDIIPARVPILYIAVIVPVAIFFGLGPSILVCFLSVLAFDYFFIPPLNTIVNTATLENIPIVLIFFAVGVVLSFLSSNLRQRTQEAVRDAALRREHEIELEKYRDHLEDLVKQRTAELETSNLRLKEELTERQRLEAMLEEKQFRLQIALDSGEIGIHEWNILTNELTWDERVYQLWGLPPGTPVTLEEFTRVIHPDDIQSVQAAIDQALQPDSEGKYQSEFRITNHKGIQRWLAATGCVSFIDKRPVKLTGATWDITERKQAEEALKKSESHYRSLFENMIDGFLYCQMLFENGQPEDFIYLAVNRAFTELTGLKDVVGKKVTQVVPGIKETNPDLFEIYGRVASGGRPERFETYVPQLKSWFCVSVYSVQRGTFVAVFENITERRKAEANNLFLSAIVESSDDAIIGKTLEGIITSWNQGAEKIYGYTRDEVIGKSVTILSPSDRVEEINLLLEQIKQRKSIQYYETERIRKDGTLIPVSLTISPIVNNQNQIIGASTIARDITERKKAEESLQKYAQELKAANTELESFSYSVSHDLRAPLRTLDGFSEVILEDYADKLDEAGKDYLNRIRSASHTMSELIDAILELSRVSRTEMHQDKIDLSDLAKSISEGLKQSQPDRQAEFVIEPGLIVKGDLALLRVALNNLLENAWKYASKSAQTRIEFGRIEKKGEPVYFIRDNGVGFDMRYSNKLFQPFQRLHTGNEYPGTGIGLATVHRVIRRHNGRIWAESETGKGTTFYFTLG